MMKICKKKRKRKKFCGGVGVKLRKSSRKAQFGFRMTYDFRGVFTMTGEKRSSFLVARSGEKLNTNEIPFDECEMY